MRLSQLFWRDAEVVSEIFCFVIALLCYGMLDAEVWNCAAMNSNAREMRWCVAVMWEACCWYEIWLPVFSHRAVTNIWKKFYPSLDLFDFDNLI